MIKILFLGKTKEKFIQIGINEYLKRLRRFARIEIVEVKSLDYNFRDDYVVLFDVNGKMLSSKEFSKVIRDTGRNIIVAIGDENGISENVKKRADLILSISSMTFTHEMARLIVMEQIYRAYTIINSMKYHR